MQIIINAILTPILIMFFLFLFIEIIFFFVNIFLYKSPLNKDINMIKNLIVDNEKEFTHSFSYLITKKYLDFKVDLLQLRQHLSFIDNNNDNILIDDSSSNKFLESYQNNCIINNESLFIENLTDFDDMNSLLNNDDLNKIYSNNTKNDEDKKVICYALLFLKSKLIQNLLNQKYELEIINTQIYYNNTTYIYPSVVNEIKNDEMNCENDSFTFSPPKFEKNNIYQLICTLMYINNDEIKICNKINLMKIFNKSYINSTNFIFNIIDEKFNLIYNSNDIINLIFNNYSHIFDSTKYKTENLINLELFHSLYYDIFKNYDINKNEIDNLEKEYIEIKNNIFLENNKSVVNTTKKYYLEYKFNNKGQKIKKKLSQSNFYFIFTPLNISLDNFNEKTNIFKNNNNDNYTFYFLSVIKEKNPRFSNNIYKIYVFKSLRLLFFFIAILILMFVIFFIIIQFIMIFLLNPIKFYQNNIEKLLDIKNDNNNNSKMDFEDFKKFINNKQFNQNKNFLNKILSNQYTNLEMKELENVISFLQKILLIRNPKIPFQQKTEFYQSISNEIPQNLKFELYKCQIIIAELYIKDKKYLNAKNELENLQKKIENDLNEIKNKSDFNELKNRNLLNNVNSYLNEYVFYNNDNYDIKNNQENNIINLKFIEQSLHYLLGLSNYYLFHEIKKRNKKINNKKRFTFKTSFYNNNNNSEINKMDFYLENAIIHFKKSYKINSHLEINLIKNIYIKILLAKCYNSFSIRKNEETNKELKKSILVLNQFNDLIKKLKNNNKIIVDSRIMLIINGIYFELILFYIGKFSIKLRKYKIAYFCFFKLLSISNFKNQKIHFKALKWLEKLNKKINDIENIQFKENSISKNNINILKENLNKYLNEIENKQEKKDEKNLINEIINNFQKNNFFSDKKNNSGINIKIYIKTINNLLNKHYYSKIDLILNSILSFSEIKKNILLISKMKNRIDLKQSLLKKCIIIIISESFSYNFNALKSFNLFLLDCLNKYLINDDKIGFIFYDQNGCNKILYLKEKKYNIEKLLEILNNISQNENFNNFYKKNSFYLTNSFDNAIDMFLDCDNFNEFDKYIFIFGKIKDIRFKYKEKAKEMINKINYLNISFYYFAFNSYKEVDDLNHYYKFFQNFIEGILILVENFKLIKSVFANFTFRGNQKNLLNINIDNINNDN